MSGPHVGSLREHYPADADLEPAEAIVTTRENTSDYDDWEPFEDDPWPYDDSEAEAFHERITGRR